MSLREIINKNPAVGIVFVVVLLVIVMMVIRGNGPARDNPLAYYYDLQTGELFVGNKSDVPPIAAPSGEGNGVLATVFACGSCDNTDEHFIAWLSKFDPQVHEQVRLLNASPDAVDASGHLIDAMAINAHAYIAMLPQAEDEDIEWMTIASPQVQSMRETAFENCPEGTAVLTCYPAK